MKYQTKNSLPDSLLQFYFFRMVIGKSNNKQAHVTSGPKMFHSISIYFIYWHIFEKFVLKFLSCRVLQVNISRSQFS